MTVPTQDSERLRKALATGDGSRHEIALGGFAVEGSAPTSARLVLCHGAGAGHDSEFLARLRRRLAARGIQVVAGEFGYMTAVHRSGRRRPPPRVETLMDELDEWRRILTELDENTPLWFGGKSMGGRVASLLATRVDLAGLVLFGYPFHPPGKPTRLRLDHWPEIRCPIVLFQGTRDPFGRRDEVAGYELPVQVECHFMDGGDHDWQVPKRLAHTQSTLIDEAAGHVVRRLGASG
ncbi:MAG: alpha/beta fold hydrolase [Salinicola sp.]|uniref:alpha/beta family hydrolase n=1 Tax=Salinicola sp. TaxID=1978524 RepID=UPI001DC19DB1|nr:alpha/beta family hydrolase [Salinicola sp.]NRB58147.1 alpha/beta fold hydrolase [Salinicola sp.]